MTDDEKFYLDVERQALIAITESNLPVMMSGSNPERGFLYLFDTAYAMGFAGARRMAADGMDIQALDPRKLSLVRRKSG